MTIFIKSGLSQNWPDIYHNKTLTKEFFIDNPIQDKVGTYRDFKNDRVLSSALTHHHQSKHTDKKEICIKTKIPCPISIGMTFPEAGPRSVVYSPIKAHQIVTRNTPKNADQPLFRIGIIVSGGTAPGINGVVNGIVQRHYDYYEGELKRKKQSIWCNQY